MVQQKPLKWVTTVLKMTELVLKVSKDIWYLKYATVSNDFNDVSQKTCNCIFPLLTKLEKKSGVKQPHDFHYKLPHIY